MVAHRGLRRHLPQVLRDGASARRLLVVLALLVLAGGCARAGGQPFQPTSNTPLVLEPGASVGQTLRPAGPVTGVDVNVATFAGPADPEGELQLALTDVEGTGRTSVAVVPGADLVDGAWAGATFTDPVEVTGTAQLEATWTGATPVALWANTTQEGTTGIANDPYPGGTLLVDGEPADGDLAGDLAFRVRGGGLAEGLAQIRRVLAAAARTAAGDLSFVLLWGTAVLLGVGAVVLGVRGARGRPGPPRPAPGRAPEADTPRRRISPNP